MNLARLFEPARVHLRRFRHPYPTLRAELDAIASDDKGMSFYPASLRQLRADDELLRGAFDRGLAVVLYDQRIPSKPHDISVYIARPDQLWRVPAHVALWDTAFVGDGRWSTAAEAQEGLLFGYTEGQRAAWRASIQRRQAAFGCATLYTLLDRAQRRSIAALGHRSFVPDEPVSLFWHPSSHELRPDAWKRVPKGTVLARVAVRWKPLRRWFAGKRRITQIDVTGAKINSELVTDIEVMTAKGWK